MVANVELNESLLQDPETQEMTEKRDKEELDDDDQA